MKDLVIKTVDIIAYIVIILSVISGVIVGISLQGVWVVVAPVVAFVFSAFSVGFWFVLSKINNTLDSIKKDMKH